MGSQQHMQQDDDGGGITVFLWGLNRWVQLPPPSSVYFVPALPYTPTLLRASHALYVQLN